MSKKLQKIKEEFNIWSEKDSIFGHVKLEYEDLMDISWLVEQAERLKELEQQNEEFAKEIKVLQSVFLEMKRVAERHRSNELRLEKQNKRYREAIEKGINATRYSNPEVAYILSEAL